MIEPAYEHADLSPPPTWEQKLITESELGLFLGNIPSGYLIVMNQRRRTMNAVRPTAEGQVEPECSPLMAWSDAQGKWVEVEVILVGN